MTVLNKVSLLAMIQKEKDGICNPAQLKHKHEFPESMALASRCIECGNAGYLKRVAAPTKALATTRMNKVAAWWQLTKKGEKFIKDNADQVKSVAQLKSEIATYQESGGRKSSKGNQGVRLSKKADSAIDSLSQLIEDHNRSHAAIKQIAAICNNYLKANASETIEG